MEELYSVEYGVYNSTKLDRQYFLMKYRKQYYNVKVKRIKTDTKGLKQYLITGDSWEAKYDRKINEIS